MVEKWRELIEKQLTSGDEMLKSYPGKLDGEEGNLALSKERLLFVNEKGFFNKKYNILLDLPYTKIGKVENTKKYELEIANDAGTTYTFSTVLTGVPALNIEQSLKELM